MTQSKTDNNDALAALDEIEDLCLECGEGYKPLIETLRQALQQPKWQPIDTAPEDCDILGFVPSKKGRGGYKSYYVVCARDEDEELSSKGEPYFYCDSGDFHHPTHWIPLPQPPTQEDE